MNFLPARAKVEGGVAILTGNGFTIKLPLNGRIDTVPEQVTVGIRSEDLTGSLTKGGEPHRDDGDGAFLGNKLLVYSDRGDERVVANLHPHQHIDIDSTSKLSSNLDCMHLFDQDPGQTLL